VPDDPYELAAKAALALRERIGDADHVAAVVLGSGWQPAADALGATVVSVPTSQLPGFTAPTVAGHEGEIRSVEAKGRRVLVLLGRNHLYEGRSEAEVVHPVRVAALAGVPIAILTNAAGGLDPEMRPGEPVLIRDHLNLTGRNPLTGPPPPEELGPRFLDLTTLYSSRLRQLAREVEPTLREGVYAGLLGPSYETPAEIAGLRKLGADLVGMSTTLEAIAAHHLGAEILAISLVSNLAAGVSPTPLDHAEVLAAGAAAAPGLSRLIDGIIEKL
jgi:purine-nucleoside phosphorylase